MNRLRRIYESLGLVILLAAYAWLIWTWIGATINGLETGKYAVTISTNLYGENYFELGLFFFLLPAVVMIGLRFRARLRNDES